MAAGRQELGGEVAVVVEQGPMEGGESAAVDAGGVTVALRMRADHLAASSCTIVLCGLATRWRRFVDWTTA